MIRRLRRVAVVVLSSVVLLSGMTAPAGAGIVPDALYALFGPVGAPWFPKAARRGYYGAYSYPPAPYYSGYAPYGYTSAGYYGGGIYDSYPAYDTYAGYAPYPGYGGGGCAQPRTTFFNPCPCSGAGGPDGVTYRPAEAPPVEPQPQENGTLPRTYQRPEGENGGSEPPVPGADDSDFQPRDQNDFQSPRPAEGRDDGSVDFGAFSEPREVEAQKVPAEGSKEGPSTVIPNAQPAPMIDPEAEEADDGSAPQPADNAGVRPLNLDGKIAWRSVPRRSRSVIESRPVRTLVHRTRVQPEENWTPGPGGRQIVKK